jgi:anaerobic magnesium-protoporphyrin IX monomethyl ester cyclase
MKHEEFVTLLVFPPQWIPLNPHFSLLSLAGHLRGEGHTVHLSDSNIRFYRYVLTEKFLDYAWKRAENCYHYLQHRLLVRISRKERSFKARCESARFLEIEKWLTRGKGVYQQIKRTLAEQMAVFSNEELFYDPCRLVKAFITVDRALEIASLPFFPAQVKFNDFFTPLFPLTLQGLLDFTKDRDENLFIHFFNDETRHLLAKKPDIIGISINSPTQLFPGLTLARMIMEKKQNSCHLTIGGNYFTRLGKELLESNDFFSLFADTVILGEGEKPLSRLITSLGAGEESLHGIPSLVFRDQLTGRVVYTFNEKPCLLNELKPQSLDGIKKASYFVPDPVISLQSSKGCYWQKCTFCDTDFGVEPDIKSPERLIGEMEYLFREYGVTSFEFIDESIPPEYMENIARRLIEKNLPLYWFSNARTETSFTEERFHLMRKSGLLMLLWGIESGCGRIMKLINKGVDSEKRLDLLNAASRAGIWNFAYIFFGFPTETGEEARETIRLIQENTGSIHSYGRSIFTLGKHAKIREKAEKLGLIKSICDDQEFSTSLLYETAGGMKPGEILDITEECRKSCAAVYGEPLWMYLRYREVLFLYLKHFGMDYVINFQFDEKERLELHRLFER